MKRILLVFGILAAAVVQARAQDQDSQNGLQREIQDFQKDCGEGGLKAVINCTKDAFTEQPVHVAVGTIAPQNGFGVGPSLVESRNSADWRLALNADAVVSTNASWRAGAYLKVIFAKHAVTDPLAPKGLSLAPEYPAMNFYVQGISLNAIDFYGIGPSTQQSSEAVFGMRETIAGANVLYPLIPRFHVSLFGELNGRFVNIRNGGNAGQGVSELYNNATAPGLANQPGFLQAGEGIRIQPTMFGDRVQPDLALTYQQFVAPGSRYSFQRLNTNVGVNVPLYHSMITKTRSYNGPDECGTDVKDRKCPVMMDKTGSVGLRLLVTQSITPAGNSVPFYFQPTIGGADINNEKVLPAYSDYRFRAPNLLVVRATFEHSIWGPLGFEFVYDIGKVAATRGDVDFNHLAHSFAPGLTLRLGGMPEVSFLFAFGGGEGTHPLLLMNNSLLGGSMRPSLY